MANTQVLTIPRRTLRTRTVTRRKDHTRRGPTDNPLRISNPGQILQYVSTYLSFFVHSFLNNPFQGPPGPSAIRGSRGKYGFHHFQSTSNFHQSDVYLLGVWFKLATATFQSRRYSNSCDGNDGCRQNVVHQSHCWSRHEDWA